MTEQELIELRTRCIIANTYTRQIANAPSYVAELESEVGPVPLAVGVAKFSAAHLVALVDKVLRVRAGEEKPAKPKARAKAKVEPPKVEVESKPKPKAKIEKPKAEPKPEVKPAPKKKAVSKKR